MSTPDDRYPAEGAERPEPEPEAAGLEAEGSTLEGTEPVVEPADEAERHRTHPITPLVTGWKIIVGVIAVLTAQNIARLLEDFTMRRALIGVGVLVAVVVVSIVLSAISWWFSTYAVDEAGVSLRRGIISRTREYAPRSRIESVSVERPLLARLLGLAKVRVEVVGGGDSHLDIEYIRSADAERLRLSILDVAALAAPAQATELSGVGHPSADGVAGPGTAAEAPTGSPVSTTSPSAEGSAGALQSFLHDGVTDGELIAQIPTSRLIRSLLRDLGFLIGTVMSVLGVAVAIWIAIWQDGLSPAVFIALLPTAIAIPKYVFGRIEGGWGFVSRITDRGLRMRRGLATTRTDNIAPGRIQRIELRRPRLWRGPGWTAVSVTVAGIDGDDDNGAEAVLPVGTHQELGATLGHLAAPLGTEDDLATIEHLLTAPAREIEGLRTRVRLYWIARRTQVAVLLPGALIQRTGILTRSLEIIPRERVQNLEVSDGPLARRLGVLDLEVGVAGKTLNLYNLPRTEVLALHAILAHDAATLRRLQDRAHWPQPALSLAGGPHAGGTPTGAVASAPAALLEPGDEG